MQKRVIGFGVFLFVAVGIAAAAWFLSPALRPAFFPVPEDSRDVFPPGVDNGETPVAVNETDFPLSLPVGFSMSIFADNVPGVRVMTFDSLGNLWVSLAREGKIVLVEAQDGKVARVSEIFKNLRNPHGLAFAPGDPLLLYYAEEHQVSRVRVYSDDTPKKILDLPAGDGHFTRTIGFGPSGKLYISIGSSCNVCNEQDERRASIIEYDPVNATSRVFARGLRNSVFFTWDDHGRMWATENGSDLLGDDFPPDELNIIQDGENYGWPICYGKNVHDAAFDKNTYIRNPCEEPFETPSAVDIQAHSAPLGLAFAPASWPEEYKDDLFVAYHGSWDRSVPTGYKLVRHRFDARGDYQGSEDFITGWFVVSGALGRPVDVVFREDRMYVSDDKAGVIYKIEPIEE